MKRGFTVLELLVASMLLGMLMTILTMIFSQSSIAWRTGVAGVSGMDNTLADVSDLRCQADDFYEWNGAHYIQSVFDQEGDLAKQREDYVTSAFSGTGSLRIDVPPSGSADAEDSYKKKQPRSPSPNGEKDNYIVNVMSYGPDRKVDTRYDNIYSVSPTDDPSLW